MAGQGRSIADFQLWREQANIANKIPDYVIPNYLDFLEPFLGATKITDEDWQLFSIYGTDPEDGYKNFLLFYAISIPKQTYVVLDVQLTDWNDPLDRLTNMRLFEMIRDTWATAAPETQLKYLGIRQIENPTSRRAISAEFDNAGEAAQMSITANNSTAWSENPFIRCAEHVSQDRSRVRVHLLRDGVSPSPANHMYMFVELDSDGSGLGEDDEEEEEEDKRKKTQH